jgi:hypothetical protein
MPRNLAPHTYLVDAERKDHGWALYDGGSAPPSSDKDNLAAADTTAPTIGEDKKTCKALGQ